MLDPVYRTAYRCAYKMMRMYWSVRNPLTHGALVAIWHDGRIVTVRNSYVPYVTLPGGYVAKGESFRDAALRELREELGLRVNPNDLTLALDVTHDWEGKHDHVQIFELVVDDPPQLHVDNREVIASDLLTPEQALKLQLFPPLRTHIEQKLAQKAAQS